jgi:hypothetical protein
LIWFLSFLGNWRQYFFFSRHLKWNIDLWRYLLGTIWVILFETFYFFNRLVNQIRLEGALVYFQITTLGTLRFALQSPTTSFAHFIFERLVRILITFFVVCIFSNLLEVILKFFFTLLGVSRRIYDYCFFLFSRPVLIHKISDFTT